MLNGDSADQAAAEGEALAGKHAGGVVGQFLHHAGHKADFTAADADVAGRHVGVRAQVAIQLGHQRLAEAHDLALAFALRIEIGAAFAAAHRQGGQRILEGLLKAEELQDRQVYRWVEAHAALIGADGRVELHAEGAIDLHLAAIVHPADAELNDTLGLHQALQQRLFAIARVALDKRPQRGEYFAHRLQIFRLVGVMAL